ncbi:MULTISPECIES: acyl carrier protein [unclassified Streptomyces]|uniref:acyl carrier protein n=1 Tax=unclassified Streptomyces TaxID=2593676 RepID=UPI002E2D13F8|nr:acyl carrier protein [Streptomyces sp. NBC_00223]
MTDAKEQGVLEVLAELAAAATDGEVKPAELLSRPEVPLQALGVGSLGKLRLVDAVEAYFDVLLDLDGEDDVLESLATVAAYLDGRAGGAR